MTIHSKKTLLIDFLFTNNDLICVLSFYKLLVNSSVINHNAFIASIQAKPSQEMEFLWAHLSF